MTPSITVVHIIADANSKSLRSFMIRNIIPSPFLLSRSINILICVHQRATLISGHHPFSMFNPGKASHPFPLVLIRRLNNSKSYFAMWLRLHTMHIQAFNLPSSHFRRISVRELPHCIENWSVEIQTAQMRHHIYQMSVRAQNLG